MSKQKNTAGGSATERGMDFQARVSAIVLTCLITEQPLSWIEDNPTIIPINCRAETGGSGDDIAFTSSNGKYFEVQVKRGFRKGDDLWDALIKLAKAIVSNDIDYGVLVVCPDSSGTIRKDLAQDIIRMGQERFDGIKDISIEFKSKLEDRGLNVSKVCSSLYIQTVNAVEGNNDAESLAKNMLGSMLDDVEKVWQVLVENSRRIIKIKGGLTLQSCHELLKNKGINIKSGEETNIQLFNKAYQYNKNAYSEISILSVQKPINLQSIWIPLEATIVNNKENESLNLDSTIERYQSWYEERRHDDTIIDSFTFGRFIKKCVVIGGAGIGKTTLFRKLALDYSDEGYFVLFIKLAKLTDMLSGSSKGFEACLIDCAFDRKIQSDNISSLLQNAVILADGLDECFQQQSEIIQYFSKLSKDYPESRILISTRPIGYKLGLISDWRRYELKPIDDIEFKSAVKQLTSVISPEIKIDEAVLKQIEAVKISHLVKRNPLILSLVVILVKRGIEANTNYASLYRQLFSLIETESPKREVSVNLPSRQLREFLYLLGWIILRDGYKPLQELVRICHEEWKEELPLRKFEAYKVIDDCIAYWVAKGIIEKVNDLTDETVLFIHKTLGEYAAAEHLKLQNIIIQEQFILEAFSNPQYSETLTFLSHLGLSSKILALWNDTYSADNKPKNINIYDFILHAGIDYKSDEIESFISLCWEITEDYFSTNRYTSGAILCHIARCTLEKIKSSVKERLESKDEWVSFIAYNCELVYQKDLTFNEVTSYIGKIEKVRKILYPTMRKPFRIDINNKTIELRNNYIMLLVKKIFESNKKESLELLDKFLEKDSSSLSMDLILYIRRIYFKNGRKAPNDEYLKRNSIFERFRSGDYIKQQRILNIGFFEAVIDQSFEGGYTDLSPKKMIELGALVNLCGIMNIYPEDFDLFLEDIVEYDNRNLVFSSLVKLSDLDYEKISRQASRMANNLKKILDEQDHVSTIHELPRVDIELAQSDKLSQHSIYYFKGLILTNERFLILNGSQLFLSYSESISFTVFLELLEEGEGLSLSYIGAMSNYYQVQENIDSIQKYLVEKLFNDKLVIGCEYLYQYLIEPFSENHIKIAEKGLNSLNPIVAIEATKLLDKISLNSTHLKKIKDFYLVWRDKEEPYPVAGGTIPRTPRVKLLSILIKYQYYDECFLQELMLDSRSDIREQAIQPFIGCCKGSNHSRAWLIDKVKEKVIYAHILKQCILENVFLNDANLVIVLLDDDNANIRENALPILDVKYLTEDKIKYYAKKLLNDEIIEIRQFARKILDTQLY